MANPEGQGGMSWAQWWDQKDMMNAQLVEAISQDNEKAIADLLDEKKQLHGLIADVNHRVESDMTPLHKAVRTSNPSIVGVLIKFFAEVNSTDCDGKSPLHYACARGSVPLAKLLIQHKAVVSLPDEEGNTPLHVACAQMKLDVVMLLIQSHADARHQNSDNKTP